MAEYTKLNLLNGDTLTAEHIAHIEDGIVAAGENKTVVDSAFSSTSTNPVQNKVVNEAISNLNTLVGETAVSAQIATAIADTAEKEHTHAVSDVTDLQEQLNAKVPTSRTVNGKALSSDIALKVSELENDAGYITGCTETDPTVPAWAKAESKPTYTAQEVGALPDTTVIPSIEGLATETYVDTAVDEIEVLTEAEIAEICGSTVGNLTVVDQDAIAEQVVDTLTEGLPNNQTFIDNVAEQVPIVKVAEEPTFVDSVDDMTDANKMYVLTTDGMFYSHKTVVIPGETTTTYPNQLVASTVELNKRYSYSSQATSTKVGYFVTDYIAVPNYANVSPYNMRLNWEVPYSTATDVKIVYYDTSKAPVGYTYIAAANTTVANGITTTDLRTFSTGGTMPTISAVAYVRIQLAVNSSMASLTATDIANLTITFDAVYETESTESVTTTEWSSTGIAYNQPADYEDRVISLEANVANNTGNISLLQERMDNLESGEVTTVIPEWWEDEVADTITKIKALQVGRHCITFPFFSDNHQRNGYSGVLIKHVMDECHIPYCFFGGDGIANGYFGDETDAEMRAQDAAFDAATSAIPAWQFCRAIGNHEYYWKVSSSETYYYTSDQVYEVFMRENTLAQSKEFGDSGTYYYVEDKASKVRFIVMDMNTLDDAVQISWLQNVALHFDEAGWAVVLIGHQPVTEHYATVIEGAEAARTVLKDYINGTSANKADIVGWWCGHIHRDRIFEGVAANPGYNGSTDTATDMAEGDPIAETLPWKTVSIISDNTSLGYGGIKHAIDNSDQSHAIDFVTINKDARTVNITRLGFGDDRSFSY